MIDLVYDFIDLFFTITLSKSVGVSEIVCFVLLLSTLAVRIEHLGFTVALVINTDFDLF